MSLKFRSFWLFLLIYFFSVFSLWAEAENTIIVLKDGNKISSVLFDFSSEKNEFGLSPYDVSRRLVDLNIKALRFSKDGEAFFMPFEEVFEKFEKIEFLGDAASGSYSRDYHHGRLRISPKKGEAFEVERAFLLAEVGDEYPAREVKIERYISYDDEWENDFLPLNKIREICFLSPRTYEKTEPEEEEQLLIGKSSFADNYSAEDLKELLLLMIKSGSKEEGRLSFSINFATDSASFDSLSRIKLDRLALVLRDPALQFARFRVEGHSDISGSAAYNLSLSKKRADAVRTYLLEKSGIESYRLQSSAYGSARPVASNKTAEGRKLNRRVELVFLP